VSGDDAVIPPFSTALETSLTLFRMMLGDFDRNWFLLESPRLQAVATLLFLLYMFIVFIILFNILIAVVCDKFDCAYSNAKTLFLRSRLMLMASLELQGLTRNRKAQFHLADLSTPTGSPTVGSGNTGQQHHQNFFFATCCATIGCLSSSTAAQLRLHAHWTFADWLHFGLFDSFWHRQMRVYLAISSSEDDDAESTESDEWGGRVRLIRKQVCGALCYI